MYEENLANPTRGPVLNSRAVPEVTSAVEPPAINATPIIVDENGAPVN